MNECEMGDEIQRPIDLNTISMKLISLTQIFLFVFKGLIGKKNVDRKLLIAR